jgi:UDP-glucose 4-epimerase
MNICVTGGAGFIGSHLCDILLQRGHQVTVVDNLSLGSLDNIAHLRGKPGFRFFQENILNTEKMNELFHAAKFGCVFHLAANSDIAQSFDDVSIDLNNTFMTSYSVLNLMRKYGVGEIVFASTSAVYGDIQRRVSEDAGPLLPVSHYGAAKLAAEGFISSFVECYGIKAWIARFPNVVGARATHGVILDFVRKIKGNPEMLEVLGDGEQNKPYMHVSDLVDALLFIWNNSRENINIYNIGIESRTKVKVIAEEVVQAIGHNTAIHYKGGSRGWVGDVPSFEYDVSKIKKLGWQARCNSLEAVKRATQEIIAQHL